MLAIRRFSNDGLVFQEAAKRARRALVEIDAEIGRWLNNSIISG